MKLKKLLEYQNPKERVLKITRIIRQYLEQVEDSIDMDLSTADRLRNVGIIEKNVEDLKNIIRNLYTS